MSIADTIADQVYLASGAFDHKQKNGPAAGPGHAAFANLAFPVLATCARLQAPPSVHHVVETMAFLSPLDEKRALLAIAEAVPGEGSYTRDSLAADVVISTSYGYLPSSDSSCFSTTRVSKLSGICSQRSLPPETSPHSRWRSRSRTSFARPGERASIQGGPDSAQSERCASSASSRTRLATLRQRPGQHECPVAPDLREIWMP